MYRTIGVVDFSNQKKQAHPRVIGVEAGITTYQTLNMIVRGLFFLR